MDTLIPPYLYKETRLDLDPTTQGSTVVIRLPVYGASTHSSRAAQKRPQIAEIPVADDENAFRQRYLASTASIYHRLHAKSQSARSFLWRVLEDGKVLSIRSVDVSRESSAADANITLRLSFPSPIRPGCIAFSDSDHHVLSAFIFTESRHLYTLNLRPEYFRKIPNMEDNVDWCKVYSSANLNLKFPHRMVALGSDELLISMVDGGLLRLERNSGGDGSAWVERHYNEGGWNINFRTVRLFNTANQIQYGGQTMELSTATSIASLVTHIGGISYAFTVCLDHRLRVWNLESGKIAYSKDILGHNLDDQEQARRRIDPSQINLVKVLGYGERSALCITYSPLGSGQFKFWLVNPEQDGSLILHDLFPENTLEPRAPSSEVWTLADFSVVIDKASPDDFTLWVLWKNNITYRVLQLEFQKSGTMAEAGDVQDAWKENWKAVAVETEIPTPTVFSGDSSDGTDKWLGYLLYPGRFTRPTIETGLAIYGRGLGTSRSALRKTGSLPDRLCATIASTASLNRASHGDVDYEQFRAATDAQWRRFYRLLQELDKQRGEAMGLVIDPKGKMPWVVLADGITAIRNCSPLERFWHNNGNIGGEDEYVARPIFAAAAFRDTLSDQFVHAFKAQLFDIFQEPALTTPARMRTFYAKCDFSNQIGDEEYAELVSGLGGGFKNVTPQVYTAILDIMNASGDFDRANVLPLAEFGNKLVVKGVQETLELHRNICLDQLVLLILIENEINHGEEGIQFESARVFNELIKLLKFLELLSWLAGTQITLDSPKSERSNSITDSSPSSMKKSVHVPRTVTVLEGVFRHLFGLDLREGELLHPVVTEVILQICTPDSRYYVAPPAVIQCFLLKQGRPDLAAEFSRFTNNDPFSTYIQGRACLASNDASTASILFKKAAFGMAYPDPKKRSDYRTAGFLDDTERMLLNAGLPEYYSHLVALFDREKNYSFVIDFARLALQFIRNKHDNIHTSHLRTEMHSRLFNASIQTARWEVAHSVLALFTDLALQHSSLRTLVTKMCELSYASQLVEMPFIGLQETVDEVLAQKCQSIVDVNVGIPYHKILYSWRIKHSDFRGAAAISLERLQRLQRSGDSDKTIGDDGLETPITKQYVALINALSCVDPKQAWVLSEELPQSSNGTGVGSKKAPPKRQVVTLDDVRRGYQAELDRVAAIQNNQFTFTGGDEMDVF